MVSKLKILSRYYQINITELLDNYFVYNQQHYYLATTPLQDGIEENYNNYIMQLNVSGFSVVVNCYNNIFSEGCVLYTFNLQTIDANKFLITAGNVNDKRTSIESIKQQWCNKIDDARLSICKYASRVSLNEYYVILSYFYQGMAENAVIVLNHIIQNNKSTLLPVNLQHTICNTMYNYIVNPHNLIIAPRTRDIIMLYKSNNISLIDIREFIYNNKLSDVEIQYMYARILYPSEFFGMVFSKNIDEAELKSSLRWCYNNLNNEMNKIIALYDLLSEFVFLPKINWIYHI